MRRAEQNQPACGWKRPALGWFPRLQSRPHGVLIAAKSPHPEMVSPADACKVSTPQFERFLLLGANICPSRRSAHSNRSSPEEGWRRAYRASPNGSFARAILGGRASGVGGRQAARGGAPCCHGAAAQRLQAGMRAAGGTAVAGCGCAPLLAESLQARGVHQIDTALVFTAYR